MENLTPDQIVLLGEAFNAGFTLVSQCVIAGVSIALVLNFIKQA